MHIIMSSTKDPFNSEVFLKECARFTTKQRQKLLKQLVKKSWFQLTDPAVQMQLARLPQEGSASFDGFIADLVRRREVIGDLTIIKMLSLPRGNFIACPVFQVRNELTKQEYTYEFAAYRYTVPNGAKGLVLVREDKRSEPTHFLILSGEKFATSDMTYELMGGYSEPQDEDEDQVVSGIIREIREECGVMNLQIEDITLLGTLVVDPGLSSHETHLFIAYITPNELKRISSNAKNIDDKELNTFVHMLPLNDLSDIIRLTNNSMLLASVAKAVANGLIPKQYCIPDSNIKSIRSTRKIIRTD